MRRTLILVAALALAALSVTATAASAKHGRHHHRHHARHVLLKGNEARPAGTIASFAGGVLTITLGNGQQVSGKVTPDTKIECENEDNMAKAARDGDDGD